MGAGCVVGPDAVLRNCILDDEVQIAAHSLIGSGAVIGRGCHLAAGARVSEELRLEPGRVLAGTLDLEAAPAERRFMPDTGERTEARQARQQMVSLPG